MTAKELNTYLGKEITVWFKNECDYSIKGVLRQGFPLGNGYIREDNKWYYINNLAFRVSHIKKIKEVSK